MNQAAKQYVDGIWNSVCGGRYI